MGAAFGAGSSAQAQSASNSAADASPWKPMRHPEDDWFDQPTVKHRFFLDTTSPEAFTQALAFARNFYTGNANGYKLADADIAQVICARHRSTMFAFNDAMWTKYGATMAERANNFVDPKTKQAPTSNIYMGAGIRRGGVERRRTARLPPETRRASGRLLARNAWRPRRQSPGRAARKSDDVFKELTENLVPNARMVPAGIVAVNRAQEHGTRFSYVT